MQEVMYTSRLARNEIPFLSQHLWFHPLLVFLKRIIELVTSIGFKVNFFFRVSMRSTSLHIM